MISLGYCLLAPLLYFALTGFGGVELSLGFCSFAIDPLVLTSWNRDLLGALWIDGGFYSTSFSLSDFSVDFLSSDFGICPLLSETGISKSGVISLLDFRPFNFAIFLFQTKLIFSLLCRYCFLLFVWSSFNSSLNKILVQSIHSELHFLDLPWPIPLQCYSGSKPSYLVKNLEMKTKVNHFLQILYHRLQFLMLKF